MARRGAVQDLTEPMTEADVFYRLLNFYGRYYWNGCILAQTFYKHGKLRDSHAEWDRLQAILELLFDTYRFVDKKGYADGKWHYKFFLNRAILFEMWQTAEARRHKSQPEPTYEELLRHAGMI